MFCVRPLSHSPANQRKKTKRTVGTEASVYALAMRIRPAGTSDCDAVADVFLSALAGMTYLPELYTDAETRAFIKDILLPNNEVWVAEDAGEVVGFVGFGQNSIRHLWVKQSAQNHGIGTALLNVAKGRCLPSARNRGIGGEGLRPPSLELDSSEGGGGFQVGSSLPGSDTAHRVNTSKCPWWIWPVTSHCWHGSYGFTTGIGGWTAVAHAVRGRAAGLAIAVVLTIFIALITPGLSPSVAANQGPRTVCGGDLPDEEFHVEARSLGRSHACEHLEERRYQPTRFTGTASSQSVVESVAVSSDAAVVGQWSDAINPGTKTVGISAIVLHTGKVLLLGRLEPDRGKEYGRLYVRPSDQDRSGGHSTSGCLLRRNHDSRRWASANRWRRGPGTQRHCRSMAV